VSRARATPPTKKALSCEPPHSDVQLVQPPINQRLPHTHTHTHAHAYTRAPTQTSAVASVPLIAYEVSFEALVIFGHNITVFILIEMRVNAAYASPLLEHVVVGHNITVFILIEMRVNAAYASPLLEHVVVGHNITVFILIEMRVRRMQAPYLSTLFSCRF
jgi:hypothetical protein